MNPLNNCSYQPDSVSKRAAIHRLVQTILISLKMPHRLVRWLLPVVLFFGSCSFYYWPVMESRIPGRFDGAPTDNSGPYLTDEEEQNAAAIVRESGVVERINDGQDWEADFQVSRRANSLAGTRGVRVEVVWKDPVDSAGPWALVHCGGTRKVVHEQPVESDYTSGDVGRPRGPVGGRLRGHK